mgnify:CR=1 FL=1
MSRLRNSLTDTNTSGGGVTDHGALTGLADDDHTQYLNTTRHTAITGNPHGTVAGDISDFNETVRDVIGTALVAGSNVTITVNDAGDTITVAASAADNERVKTNRYLVADSPATWTKESWAKRILVTCIGGGGGGAAGFLVAAGSTSFGGGGGSGGGLVIRELVADDVSSTVTVTVGSGGSGGAAISNGNAGNDGSASSFGSYVYAVGGLKGSGITGGSLATNRCYVTMLSSTRSGTNGGAAASLISTTTEDIVPGGGGGGGEVNSGGTALAGGRGTGIQNITGVISSGTPSNLVAAGGTAPGGAGNNGPSYGYVGMGGSGGGGGVSVGGGNGGDGGLYGGGGGGGGGARTGQTRGAGGNGANGIVVVTQFG